VSPSHARFQPKEPEKGKKKKKKTKKNEVRTRDTCEHPNPNQANHSALFIPHSALHCALRIVLRIALLLAFRIALHYGLVVTQVV
jgi:hypothetical protein